MCDMFVEERCCFTCFDGYINEIGETQLLLLAFRVYYFFSVMVSALLSTFVLFSFYVFFAPFWVVQVPGTNVRDYGLYV